MPAPRKSAIYQYYTEKPTPEGNKRCCNACTSARYDTSTGITNLKKHLKTDHPILYREFIGKEKQLNPSSPPTDNCDESAANGDDEYDNVLSLPNRNSTQISLKSSLVLQSNGNFPKMMGLCFAKLSLPLRIAEEECFKNMLYAFRQSDCEIPGRKKLKTIQEFSSLEFEVEITKFIKNKSESTPVSIAIDGWTNRRKEKVTNVLILCDGKAFFWRSIVNKFNRNTANWVTPQIKLVIDSILSKGIQISSLISDNENLQYNIFDVLSEYYPFLIHIPCAAHTFDLCIRHLLKIPALHSLLKEFDNILEYFSTNKDARLDLKKYKAIEQKTDNPTGYMLLKPCTTRWAAILYCIERMLELNNHISVIYPQRNLLWKELNDLKELLLPFRLAINVVQRNTSTLYHLFLQFQSLKGYFDDLSNYNTFKNLESEGISILEKQWNEHTHSSAAICCAMLSFESSYLTLFSMSERVEAKKWLMNFGVNYLYYYKIFPLKEQSDLYAELLLQHAAFSKRLKPFDDLQKNIEAISSRKSYNPKLIWSHYSTEAPELSTVAIVILSLGCSEAAVERSFHAQAIIHNKLRNRMTCRSVQKELFLKINSDQMSEIAEEPLVEEIPIDNMPDPEHEDDTDDDDDYDCVRGRVELEVEDLRRSNFAKRG